MKARAFRPVAALSVVVSLAAGACGGGAQTPDEVERDAKQAVQEVIRESNEAFFRDDWKKTCSLYTRGAQVQIVRAARQVRTVDTCEDAWQTIAQSLKTTLSDEQLDALRRDLPTKVRVSGDLATAYYGPPPSALRGLRAPGATVRLKRHGDRWLIASLPR